MCFAAPFIRGKSTPLSVKASLYLVSSVARDGSTAVQAVNLCQWTSLVAARCRADNTWGSGKFASIRQQGIVWGLLGVTTGEDDEDGDMRDGRFWQMEAEVEEVWAGRRCVRRGCQGSQLWKAT